MTGDEWEKRRKRMDRGLEELERKEAKVYIRRRSAREEEKRC